MEGKAQVGRERKIKSNLRLFLRRVIVLSCKTSRKKMD